MKHILVSLLFLCSCATSRDSSEWKNHKVSEVLTHPYFRTLTYYERPEKDGTTLLTFRDTTPGNSQGYCAQTGGCRTLATVYCDYHFTTRDGEILELDKSGTCPMSQRVLRPR